MPPANNPAQRLADVLIRLKTQDPARSIKESLQSVLSVDDDVEFLHALGYLVGLPGEIETLVRKVADEHDDVEWLLKWQHKVDGAVRRMWALTSSTQTVTQQYDDADIAYLQACSQTLSRARVEPRIDADKLVELNNQIDSLYSDLLADTEMPALLKDFILGQLDRIRRAVRQYVVHGPVGLEEVLEATLGAIFVKSPKVEDDSPRVRTYIERLKTILAHLQLTATTATGMLNTASDAQAALERWMP
ncbi:hypothetical protein [Nocardia cyriacigeorgica]|uniref:hypothetical protein n=1 Tax=Nocardia cyriacigeorgica TaxID=135487 RepID=UPI002453B3F3|nr:hypothetical protein [Nocardia cyriacigeorgica]